MIFCISVKYRNVNSDNHDLLSVYYLVPRTVQKHSICNSSKDGCGICPILRVKIVV